MEKQGITLFYELCRLCLNKAGRHYMFANDELLMDIYTCTGVRVSEGDNLPQKICTSCLDIIKNAKELRLLAVSNDTHLRFLFEEDCNSINEMPDIVAEEVEIPSTECVTIIQNDKQDMLPNMVIDEIRISKEISQNSHKKDIPDHSNKKDIPDHSHKKDIPDHSHKKDIPDHSHKKDIPDHSHKKDISDQCDAKPSARVEHGEHHKEVRKIPKDNEEYQCKKYRKDIHESSASTQHTKITITLENKQAKHEDYQCEVCQKKFAVYKKFYLHQRSHNKKLFCPIDICGKSFASRGDLMKHVRVHTGEKPFSCDLCDKKFTQNVTLKQHKETHFRC